MNLSHQGEGCCEGQGRTHKVNSLATKNMVGVTRKLWAAKKSGRCSREEPNRMLVNTHKCAKVGNGTLPGQ